MKYLLLVLLTFVVSGCATNKIHTDPTEVKTVVTSCPQPPVVAQPSLLTPTLTEADKTNYGKVATYYEADIVTLTALVEQYKVIVDNYKKLHPVDNK